MGHEGWVGDATQIRRRARSRQKTDRRDAELLIDLLLKGEFPRIHRLSFESLEVLRRLRYRHRLVQMRTRMRNSLQAIALGSGVVLKSKLRTRRGREKLLDLSLSPVLSRQRSGWSELIAEVERRIAEVEGELEQLAAGDERVLRLRTNPGVGLLTGLALVRTLCPVERFADSREVTAYVGLEPREHTSGERKRMGHISKAGSRVLRFLEDEHIDHVLDVRVEAHVARRQMAAHAEARQRRAVDGVAARPEQPLHVAGGLRAVAVALLGVVTELAGR
ncbi:MAG TPA: transposase [Pyrinomonadaceae bacterium]